MINYDRTGELKLDKYTPHVAFTDVIAKLTDY